MELLRPLNDSGFATQSVAYTGTDVQLTLAPAALPTQGLINPNNVAVAINGAVKAGASPNNFFPLFNLSAPAMGPALQGLTGEIHSSVDAIGFDSNDQFLRLMLNPHSALARANSAKGVALWGSGFGLARQTFGDSTVVGSNDRHLHSSNLGMGLDFRNGNGLTLGVAGAWGKADTHFAATTDSANADVTQAGAYAIYDKPGVQLGLSLAYADMKVATRRTVPIFANAVMSARYGAHSWSARAEAAKLITSDGKIDGEILAAYRHIAVSTSAFAESASSNAFAALNVAGRTARSNRTELGLRASTARSLNAAASFYLQGSWAHEFNAGMTSVASISGLAGSSFTVFGAKAPADSVLVRAGFNWKLSPQLSLGGRAEGEVSNGTREIGGMAQITYAF